MAPKRVTAAERFGRELRAACDAAGIHAKDLAQAINVAPSTLTNWMQGRHAPHSTHIERAEKVLKNKAPGYPEGFLKRYLKEWVSEEISPEWSEWMEVEEDTSELLAVRVDVVPGLLQTEEYARAVLPSEDLVQQRLERQELLHRENAPMLDILLCESILYRMIGNESIMAEQLRHLTEMAERDNVFIRIVRLDSGTFARFAGPFYLASLHSGKQVAHVDAEISGRIVERPQDLSRLRRMWAEYSAGALSAQESIDLTQKVIEERWGEIT